MAWAAMAIMAVGSIMKGVAEMQANRQNAAFANAEGKQALVTGEAEAARVRKQVAATQGTLMASAGAQGTTLEGSPIDVYIDNALQGEMMAQDKIYEGKLIKRSKSYQANLYKRQAGAAMLGGLFQAGSSAASAYGGGGGGGGGSGG